MRRLICVLVCLCLLPSLALGEETPSLPVTSTDFSLTVSLDPAAYENTGSRLRDWQTFLGKLSVTGNLKTRDLFGDNDYLGLDAALNLSSGYQLPFTLGYMQDHVWAQSPAIGGELIHGAMLNFYEFMLKPYFFMGLRTDLISLMLYPSGAYWVGNAYYQQLQSAFAGEGTRNIPYDALYELCLTLDDLIFEEDFQRPTRFFRTLFLDIRQEENALYALSDLESWVDQLDPGQQGLNITVENGKTSYALGQTTLMTREETADSNQVTLTLPDTEGRALTMIYRKNARDLLLDLTILREDGETGLHLMLDAKNLPDGSNEGQGEIKLLSAGAVLDESERFDLTLPMAWTTDSAVSPAKTTYTISCLAPKTGKAGLTMTLTAQSADATIPSVSAPVDVFDIFGMNGAVLDELKDRIKKPLVLSMVPFALEMPAGVINDLIRFAYDSNLLATLGIE